MPQSRVWLASAPKAIVTRLRWPAVSHGGADLYRWRTWL
jgi:hypothetical protein